MEYKLWPMSKICPLHGKNAKVSGVVAYFGSSSLHLCTCIVTSYMIEKDTPFSLCTFIDKEK